MPSSKVDWGRVYSDYLQHPMLSMPDLAKRHGVPVNTLKSYAQRHGWGDDKAAIQRKATQRVRKQAVDVAARQLGKLQNVSAVLDDVLSSCAEIARRVQTAALAADDADKRGDGAATKLYLGGAAKQAADLAKALRDATAAKRDLYALPTWGELRSDEIARQRLALDERKVTAVENAARQDAAPVVVTITGVSDEEAGGLGE